jgi:putative ATP-dependent endonuclease of the OLD family
MSILIKSIRVFGFRGLHNIEVELEATTVLTGMNNSGKTSFLKALQLALGNRQFICQDDFYILNNEISNKIIVDVKIIPVDAEGKAASNFPDDWEILFTEDKITTDFEGNSFVAFRTVIAFDAIKNIYKPKQFTLQDWPVFKSEEDTYWFEVETSLEKNYFFEELPFFYIDAQRDILEDVKMKNSYLGKMLSKIEYSPQDIETIEIQIKELNEKTVNSSAILSNIKEVLKELDTAMDSSSEGIEITPFTKKLRDLNKGLSIYYTDRKDSFSMEYHGMGTRSWASLLTLKSFITLLSNNSEREASPFFPILALEEPEAHLHPNAQKKLYQQINPIKGQKIISTHSPYISASAELNQIRSFYKGGDDVVCGKIITADLGPEDIRKIKRQVVNTRGEIFFSKLLIFFEGETEEQALPILAERYFEKNSIEMAIDFVGVGGYGSYLPFIRVAEALNIPWLILSDAEVNVKESVKKQFSDSKSVRNENDVIVFLEDGLNFEKQLISDGFQEQIRACILEIELLKCHNERHADAKREEINGYDDDRLYEIISGSKTSFGPAIAQLIVKSGKPLSPKVLELFEKITEALTIEDKNAD